MGRQMLGISETEWQLEQVNKNLEKLHKQRADFAAGAADRRRQREDAEFEREMRRIEIAAQEAAQRAKDQRVIQEAERLVRLASEDLFVVQLPELKTCPSCAEDIKFVAKKCRYCGEEFPKVDEEVKAFEAEAQKNAEQDRTTRNKAFLDECDSFLALAARQKSVQDLLTSQQFFYNALEPWRDPEVRQAAMAQAIEGGVQERDVARVGQSMQAAMDKFAWLFGVATVRVRFRARFSVTDNRLGLVKIEEKYYQKQKEEFIKFREGKEWVDKVFEKSKSNLARITLECCEYSPVLSSDHLLNVWPVSERDSRFRSKNWPRTGRQRLDDKELKQWAENAREEDAKSRGFFESHLLEGGAADFYEEMMFTVVPGENIAFELKTQFNAKSRDFYHAGQGVDSHTKITPEYYEDILHTQKQSLTLKPHDVLTLEINYVPSFAQFETVRQGVDKGWTGVFQAGITKNKFHEMKTHRREVEHFYVESAHLQSGNSATTLGLWKDQFADKFFNEANTHQQNGDFAKRDEALKYLEVVDMMMSEAESIDEVERVPFDMGDLANKQVAAEPEAAPEPEAALEPEKSNVSPSEEAGSQESPPPKQAQATEAEEATPKAQDPAPKEDTVKSEGGQPDVGQAVNSLMSGFSSMMNQALDPIASHQAKQKDGNGTEGDRDQASAEDPMQAMQDAQKAAQEKMDEAAKLAQEKLGEASKVAGEAMKDMSKMAGKFFGGFGKKKK